jgi:predicted PurR-regulated permease PerM
LPIGFYVGGLAGLVLAVPITAVLVSVARSAIAILVPDTPTNLPEMVPAWLDVIAQWSWRALIAIIFVAGLGLILTTIPLVVLPVILGLILAATIGPIANALVHRGQSRGRASAIAVGGSTFALVVVLALTIASLVDQAEEIADTSVSGAESVNEAAGGQLSAGVDALQSGADAGVAAILELTGDLAAVAIVLILTVLLTFYFLRDGGRLWKALMSHLPTDVGSELSDAGGRAFGVLGGYMFGTGAISLVGAASQLVIMWILGLPLALPIFVLSFFGGFIPYIGSLLTTMLAFLVAVAVGDTMDIVIMGIWTVAFNLVQGNIVAPMVYNRTTSIHPAIVLAAIPAGSAVAGILGMFLVVPVLGVVSTSWRSVLKIMGGGEDEPTVPPQDDIAGIEDEVAAPDVT